MGSLSGGPQLLCASIRPTADHSLRDVRSARVFLGVAHLVDFEPRNWRGTLRSTAHLEGAPLIQTPPVRTFFRKHGSTQAWVDGSLSISNISCNSTL
jgi:hypothetical protein